MKPELNYKSIDSIEKQPKFIYDMANFDFLKIDCFELLVIVK